MKADLAGVMKLLFLKLETGLDIVRGCGAVTYNEG